MGIFVEIFWGVINKGLSFWAFPVFAEGLDRQIINDVKQIEENGESTPLTVEGATSDTEAVQNIAKTVVRIAIPVGAFALGILFFYAVFIVMRSQGNPEKLNEAKDVVVSAVSGFVFIVLCAAILLTIANIFNIPTQW